MSKLNKNNANPLRCLNMWWKIDMLLNCDTLQFCRCCRFYFVPNRQICCQVQMISNQKFYIFRSYNQNSDLPLFYLNRR